MLGGNIIVKKELFKEITVTDKLYIQSADYGFLQFTGLDMNACIKSVVDPDDLPSITNIEDRIMKAPFEVVLRIKKTDGKYYPFLVTLSSLKSVEQKRFLVQMRFVELSLLTENKQIFDDTKKLFEAYLDVIGDVLVEYDRKCDELEVFYISDSQRHQILTGKLDEVAESKRKAIYPEYLSEYEELLKNMKTSEKSFRSKLKVIKGEENVFCTVLCKVVGTKVIGCVEFEPLDDLKNVNIDIVNDKDVFLDMLNKRAIVEQAERLMSRGLRHVYFILLDLDNFKNVNDTYGHMVGDEVLQTVTRIINANIVGRGIVGRMGGDEILIVTENVENQTELRNMLRSIRTTVEWTFKNDPRDINVTCSMGVCEFPDYGKDFQTVYAICDKMLYVAKEKGKNRYIIYTPELHDRYLYANSEQNDNSQSNDFINDKIGIMHRLVDNYLTQHSYNNEKIFSQIGNAFALSEILMIYENFTVAFQWTPEGVFSDIGTIVHFKPGNDFAELFNKDNILVLDGLYKLEGNCPEIRECLEKKDVNAAIFYKIDRADKFSGYVMFAKPSSRRQSWSEYEIMALSTAAKVFDVSMHD